VSAIPEVSVVVLLEVADAALLGLHGAASAAATASTDAGLRDDGRSVCRENLVGERHVGLAARRFGEHTAGAAARAGRGART